MKNLFITSAILSCALIICSPAVAQSIRPEEAAQYVETNVTVEGQVSQVSQSGGGTIFINFGGTYPDEVFFAVIFADYAAQFPDVFSLEGATIAVTGTVQMYKGKPEIIITSPSQIEIR